MTITLSEIKKIRCKGGGVEASENRKIRNRISSIVFSLGDGWSYVSSGSQRQVYRRGNVVIKIPINLGGVKSNILERKIFISRMKEGIFAPCRLMKNGCLMMRALDDLYLRYSIHPEWSHDLFDGPQIGKDRNGKIMAYDYSDEY